MTRLPILFVATALVVTGCKKKPVDGPNDPIVTDPVEEQTGPRTAEEGVTSMVYNFGRVHFPLDSHTLDAPSKAALAANVEIMQKFPTIEVEVQGHADERGTIDYNVALGQRRADAVRTYMTEMGVAPSRVRLLSYGEERPLSSGHDEVAWSENRRVEFRITAGTDPKIRGTVN